MIFMRFTAMLSSPVSPQTQTLTFKLSADDDEEICDFPLPPRGYRRTSDSPSNITVINKQVAGPSQNQASAAETIASSESEDREMRPKPNSKKSVVSGNYRRSSGTDTDIFLLTEQIDCLQIKLDQERRARAEDTQVLRKAVHKMYNDFNSLVRQEKASLLGIESKVETLITGYRNCQHEVHSLRRKFESTLDTVSQLWYRVDAVEKHTPSVLYNGERDSDPLYTRDDDHTTVVSLLRRPWSAQIVFVLDAARPNVFEVDGVAYLKIQSRRPSQKVYFSDNSSIAFTVGVDEAFPSLLQNKKWMPLACSRVAESSSGGDDSSKALRIALERLGSQERSPDTWTRQFLEEKCITYDMSGNAHIYVSLQEGKFSWKAINTLPNDAAQEEARPRLRSPIAARAPTPIVHPRHRPAQKDGGGGQADAASLLRFGGADQSYHLSAFNSPRASDYRSGRTSVESNSFVQQQQWTAKLPAPLPPSPSGTCRRSSTQGNTTGNSYKVELSLDSSPAEPLAEISRRKNKNKLKLSRGRNSGRDSGQSSRGREGESVVNGAGGGGGGGGVDGSSSTRGGGGGGWLGRFRKLSND